MLNPERFTESDRAPTARVDSTALRHNVSLTFVVRLGLSKVFLLATYTYKLFVTCINVWPRFHDAAQFRESELELPLQLPAHNYTCHDVTIQLPSFPSSSQRFLSSVLASHRHTHIVFVEPQLPNVSSLDRAPSLSAQSYRFSLFQLICVFR